MQNQETTLFIPGFTGFYESIHSDAIDSAIESIAYDDETGESNPALLDCIYDNCNFAALRNDYARAFVDYLAIETGIKLSFAKLVSPREYNFETDRIKAVISYADIKTMIRKTDKTLLAEKAQEYFSDRSGFISFYSPDYNEWNWQAIDANQLMVIFAAYLESNGFSMDEIENNFIESITCNGHMDNWLYQHCPQLNELA
jgi:hypothetical protein